jgi:hypothetical protein
MQRSTSKVISLGDRHSFIRIAAHVGVITATLKRPGKNGRRARLVSAYAGLS